MRFRNLKPIIFQNSVIPKILSYLAPIEINAISIFPFVFCRGEISERTVRHETIHFQQQLETLVLFFYLIYFWDYLKLKASGLSGRDSYLKIRAEREAYENQDDMSYLISRKRWSWLRRKAK